MKTVTRIFQLIASVGLPALCLQGEVRLPSLLSDHMVLQRGQAVHIWGRSAPGEIIAVTFRGNTLSTTADDIGTFSVYLPPGQAGGPFELQVKGENVVTLRDVMVGEVWVGSGQSNMEFALKNAVNGATEVSGAQHRGIRLFHVKNKSADVPIADADAEGWQPCTPESAAAFSAVAYFFGRDLSKRTNVPIGLIESSWGGTPVEAWMSLRALSSSAQFMPAFAQWWQMIEDQPIRMVRRERVEKAWRESVAQARSNGKPDPSFPYEANLGLSWMPGGLFNAMIAPLTAYPIAGVIWYQGESNASPERAPLYAAMFEAMIRDWRRAWSCGDFPFLFVQLANFKTGPNSRWPALREAQTQTLGTANTGMAVTIDIGEPSDIHPKNKQEVGRRLALAARALAYGEKMEYSGPLFRTAVPEGSAMRVWFDHTGSGLEAKGGGLKGFEIAGPDKKFMPADARLDERTVVVSSASVPHPWAVRYGWADNPDCNLYNREGLPASPFRSRE